MIQVTHLSKSFNGQRVLDDINLEVKEAEIFAILGESGTGKSVFLKHLIGLLKPDQGEVTVAGQDITHLSESELLKVRKKIGYLFQEGALYDFMTVFENVAFPLREHTDFTADHIEQKVHEILKMVDLEDVNNKYPSELSGGMRKRVGLARAMVLDSRILFCDEPTSGLDPIRSRDISNLICQISRDMKCTTVMTSHDIPNSFRIADRLALMHQGKIVAVGTTSELKASEDPFVKQFIL